MVNAWKADQRAEEKRCVCTGERYGSEIALYAESRTITNEFRESPKSFDNPVWLGFDDHRMTTPTDQGIWLP